MGIATATTFLVVAVLTPLLAAWARRRDFLDVPNSRSSHVIATPRIGGAALVLGICAGLLVLLLTDAVASGIENELGHLFAGALAIAVLGLLDDFRQLPALLRLVVQIGVAAWVVMAIGPSGYVASAVTILWIVTLTNAYNFMDGIDGIAGAQALVAGLGWTIIGVVIAVPTVTAMGLLLAAASAGFLVHNWHPAKVFMGDAGSGFFGFTFAALPLIDAAPGATLWWSAALMMWPFLVDTGFTLLRRASRGENILSAHRSHVYQRLVLAGRSHRYVTLVYASLTVLGVIGAVGLQTRTAAPVVLAAAAIPLAAGAVWWSLRARERPSRNR